MKQLMTLFVTLLTLVTGCSQQADDATFPQSNVSMVIPYGAGGGFDTTVRVFAPYFAKHLGGGITVLPENIPGTGGRRGTATVYRAKSDGYTLGIFNLPGLVLPSVLGEKVDYELRELSWIGRVESQDYVLLVPSSSTINSIQDLQAQEKITFVYNRTCRHSDYGRTARFDVQDPDISNRLFRYHRPAGSTGKR